MLNGIAGGLSRDACQRSKIKAKQRIKKGKWIRNDRLLAIACHSQTHDGVRSIKGLRPHLMDEIKEFCVGYNNLRDREFKPMSEVGPEKAKKLLQGGMKAFVRCHKSKAS
jgi:inorganic pyrophosphatase